MTVKRLIYCVHGYTGTPDTFADVTRLAEQLYTKETANTVICRHRKELRLTSRYRAAAIVSNILEDIDALHLDGKYDEIILVGHSTGASLIRRALIEATGLSDVADFPIQPDGAASETPRHQNTQVELRNKTEYALTNTANEGEKKGITLIRTLRQDWANKVSRLVLISGIGSGWSLEHASGVKNRIGWRIGSFFGSLISVDHTFTMFDLREGSPFLTQTRLRWMQMRRRWQQDPNLRKPLEVFQIIGTVDGTVPPIDQIDMMPGDDIKHCLLEMPKTNHMQSIRLGFKHGLKDDKDDLKARRDILAAALTGDLERNGDEVGPYIRRPEHMTDAVVEPDWSVKNVVFVIHGIRDHGYWTSKIATRVRQLAADGGRTITYNPSYGYFAMLPFILPWVRRRKVEWLMHRYALVRMRYPAADFHYMGHSNGTYLCAAALRLYPMAVFKRVMFAGSVVRQDFPWAAVFQSGRTDKVMNLLATKDLVVAWFPNAFRAKLLRFFDLGGAGHEGFTNANNGNQMVQISVPQQHFVEGGHRAAREEDLWDEIAEFIVDGKAAQLPNQSFLKNQPNWMYLLGKSAPLALTSILFLVIAIGFSIASPLWIDPIEAKALSWGLMAVQSLAWGLAVALSGVGLCYALATRLGRLTGVTMGVFIIAALFLTYTLWTRDIPSYSALWTWWAAKSSVTHVCALIAYFLFARTVTLKL